MTIKQILVIILLILLAGCATDEVHEEIEQEPTDTEPVNEPDPEPVAIIDDKTDILTELDVELKKPLREERRGPEFPSERELAELPECDGLLFDTYPVNIEDVTSITGLGNLGPPGHTFPTDHPHLHMGEHGSTDAYDLFAPADVTITHVAYSKQQTQDPVDYVIYFNLCKDVIGYYNHAKTVSDELQEQIDELGCNAYEPRDSGQCATNMFLEIEAGTFLGTVGLKQGNFDFGLIDLRKPLDFISPEKMAERSVHMQCAFDYYPEEMKKKFYSLIDRDDDTCGSTMQDVPGTLKGNWFYRDTTDTIAEWNNYLAFVEDFEMSEVRVVSVGGVFTDPGKFEFETESTGTVNRAFVDVTPDGNVYCYEAEKLDKFQPKIPSGSIIVELVSENELQIEHRNKKCGSSHRFNDPEVYIR